ncbi:MAG: Gfo/Idh/MocA family oxidoreductase [Proteobacteria bacterium]|nr:Gfo/Idh/MocA family oxidoreductase [Pseudomonadota bacterium]MCG2831217.1 Gfo/Idh/MocA family oxidoreductase [Desulfobacteraceae bacterium]
MNKSVFSAPKDIKRVGIVGCGNIAGFADDDVKKRHIYTHAKAIGIIKQLKISACCDKDETRLKAFAERWGIPGQYLNLQQMLREEQIDILVVATPTDFHYEDVMLGLSSNVEAVLCEKPLTWHVEDGIKLVAKSEQLNKLLVVNHMRRWDQFYLECKRILDSGELGRIETIVAYVDTALYMNSSHMIDMIIFFGGDVYSVVGYIDKLNEPRIVHSKKDFGGIATVRHKNGIITFLKATGESQQNHFFELDFQCTKGRLRILGDDMKYEVYRFKDSPQHKGLCELALEYTKLNDNKNERVVEAYLDILNYLEHKKQPLFPAEEALKSLELINLIYESDSKDNSVVYSRLGKGI